MSIFIVPQTLAEETHHIMNSYRWGCDRDRDRNTKGLSWDKLSMRKDESGMDLRNFNVFNIALLGKQEWRIMTQQNTLVLTLFKTKYLSHCDFHEMEI